MSERREYFASSCMKDPIGKTLEEISELPEPIIRSCHIGNNTSNNWAWLKLAGNTRMVQFDHTLYGVDEVAVAWSMLGDNGIVKAWFTYDGKPIENTIGSHVNDVIRNVSRKYSAYLNYGTFADYQGEDLFRGHYRISEALRLSLDAQPLSFDCLEIIRSTDLLADVLHDVMRRRLLHKVIDRWVKCSKNGQPIMQRIARIEEGDDGSIQIWNTNRELLYRGDENKLIESLLSGARSVVDRVLDGTPPHAVNYPWLNVAFNYMTHTLQEYSHDPGRSVFWHAGGSASSYYINSNVVRTQFCELAEIFCDMGFLPAQARLRFIPTFSCQLFGTTTEARSILESVIDIWRDIGQVHQQEMDEAINQLALADDPSEAVNKFWSKLTAVQIADLTSLLDAFNSVSRNRLPVAHIAQRPIDPSYNKYGISQSSLLGQQILFPSNLMSLTWGQAELLIKVLALMTIESKS
jgi:hypothetical protein